MAPHSRRARALDIRNQFDAIGHDLSLPKTRRELTFENAMWFLTHGKTFNANRARFQIAFDMAQEYVTIAKEKTR